VDIRPLWQHQVDAIRMAETTPDVFLAFEQGTGKTRTAIEIARRRFAKKGRVMKTLIISPIIVCDNWKKEWKMFSKVDPNDVLALTQSGKKRCERFIQAVGEDLSRNKIILTNYQGMLIDDFYKLIEAWRPELIICDESQRVKNHSSKTAKKIVALAERAEQRMNLTGTPILQSPMDLWMQYRILDLGQTLGKNFFAFRGLYFRDSNSAWSGKESHFPKWEPTEETYVKLQEKLKPTMLRVLKSECLDLPPLVRQEVMVEMSPDQARMYKEMKEEFLAFVRDAEKKHVATVTAQLAITKALRLQQILSGYAQTEQTGVIRVKDNPRLKALSELLEDITPGAKVIVWAVFKENYKMITELCDSLKIGYAQIHGDISHAQRIEEMDRFRTDPKCRVMVANQQAGGAGINLVEASYSIYYSKNFSLEQDLQSEARNYRAGSEVHTKITRIDLVAKNTIDEQVNFALSQKANISELILGWSRNEKL